MSNPDIVSYITQARASGSSDEQIRQTLLSAGWASQDVEDSFGGQPAVGLKMSSLSFKFPAKLPKFVVVIIVVAAVLIGGFFVSAKFFPEVADIISSKINSVLSFIPFLGGAPYESDEILKAFQRAGMIDSARYHANLYLETQDRDPNLRPLIIKMPDGDVPADLKNVINSGYDYYSTTSGADQLKTGDAQIIDMNEVKPLIDKQARDSAKLSLVSTLLQRIGSYYSQYKKEPSSIAELERGSTYYGTVGKLAPLQGKYFTYTPSSDLKSFKLTVTFESKQTIQSLKQSIESIKENTYTKTEYKDQSVVINGNEVTFNEGAIDFSYYFYYRPQSVAEQLTALFAGSGSEYLSWMPGRFKVNIDVGGIMQGKESDSKGFYIQLGGKADFEDLVVEADVEFTNINSDSFLKINKFPSLFMDTSKVRGEWIRLPGPKNPDEEVSGDDPYSDYAEWAAEGITSYREGSDSNLPQLRKLAALAEKEQIITATGRPVKEQLNGETVYKYQITIDENKLPTFYDKAVVELQEYGEESLMQSNEVTEAFLKTNGFKEMIRYLKDVSKLYIWVDASGGILKYEYNIKYIPSMSSDEQVAESKQFYISGSIELSDVNKDLEIKKPDKFLEWKTALAKLFGVSEEQFDSAQTDAKTKARDAKRVADINQLRSAAELYFDDNGGHYPTALDVARVGKYLASSTLPKDPVTGASYFYSYSPAVNPTKFHIWTELESKSSGLNSDADINSTGWSGNTTNASGASSEACTTDYNSGAARDCVYDVGQK